MLYMKNESILETVTMIVLEVSGSRVRQLQTQMLKPFSK